MRQIPPNMMKYCLYPNLSANSPRGMKVNAATRYGNVTKRDASVLSKEKSFIINSDPRAIVVRIIEIVSILSTTNSQ